MGASLRWYASVQCRIRELGIGFTFPGLHLYFRGLHAFNRSIPRSLRLVRSAGA
ncbi:MAG TPA: hypothetical protein VE645_10600 [Pseudonocardiaceae bacterium]|nr:hypothetical protein [Pseudonocardiaceae bacterium]